jgi:hypothetical protein
LIIPSTRAIGIALRPQRKPHHFAWSCRRCGHILANIEAVGRCAGCGLAPGSWWGASIPRGAADRDAPAVGHAAGDVEVEAPATEHASSIAVGPAGTSGYDVNPELRIRY